MEEKREQFPYLELLGIVLASALVTAGIFWVWHMVGMYQIRALNEKKNNAIREEIAILQGHIEAIGVPAPIK